MALSSRRKTALWVFAVVVGGRILDFLWDALFTVPRLNVEQWAREHEYDQLYKVITSPPDGLITAWNFLIGPFGLGFALGALAFGIWEVSARKQAMEALDDLYAEGVKRRNRLLNPIKNYNADAERQAMRDWSDRVGGKLREARVRFRDRMNFRTFNVYTPKPIESGAEGRSQAQIQLETIYNEKLRKLEDIVDRLEAQPEN